MKYCEDICTSIPKEEGLLIITSLIQQQHFKCLRFDFNHIVREREKNKIATNDLVSLLSALLFL